MENWAETRAALERKLLDAKKIVLEYEHTLKPFRNVTDAEYRQAKRDITNAATDYEQTSQPIAQRLGLFILKIGGVL